MKKTYQLFIFPLLIYIITQSSFAQNAKIDSFLSLIPKDKEDTLKVIHLNKLCWEYQNAGIYDTAYIYGNNALELGKKLNYKKGIASSLNNLGVTHWKQGDYNMALENYFTSMKIREKIALEHPEDTLNKQSIATCYNNIGVVYKNQGNYDKALEYYLTALKTREQIGVKKEIADSYNNIGVIFWKLGNFDKALENYFASLKIKEEIGDKKGIAYCYSNIGVIYWSQGNAANIAIDTPTSSKKFSLALQNHFKSLKMDEEIGDKKDIAMDYNNIGVTYFELGNYDLALENYSKSLNIKKEIGDKAGIVNALNNIGIIYKNKKNYPQALFYLHQGLKLSRELGSKEQTMESYLWLSETYAKLGDFKNSFEYHQFYSQIKDSIFNEQSQKQITEMQTKYETEKKEQQIKLLNKDKEIQTKDLERQKTIRNAVAGGLILVLFFSFVLINRLLLIRKQKKVIEIERGKSEKLLLNILPKEIAEELKQNTPHPKSLSKGEGLASAHSPLSFGEGPGVRRWLVTPKRYEQVTVMFTDFKGFTTIAEKMSAEELVSELDFIFKKFDEIISKYPIEKIKTIGDAYMCAGGLPVANTTNPVDVVMAGLEIQEFMCLTPDPSPKERGELPPLRGGLGWGLRIGIHTGSVIAGVVGDKKFAYDIWGDTVNTASRMESSGEAGKVNISGETYKMLVGTRHAVPLRFTFRGKIPAKNKGEIEMYFVERKTI